MITVKIGELHVKMDADTITALVINHLVEEDLLSCNDAPEDFDLCNISWESTTDEISFLFGEKLGAI
jgi:hypothetical protein